jgi:toxin CcdB
MAASTNPDYHGAGMARFDIYRNPETSQRDFIPFLLDVQNSFISLGSRVVIPLLSTDHLTRKVRDLNPEFEVGGQTVVLHTSAIAALDESHLRRPIGNLSTHHATIQQALDTLFGGY